MIIKFDRSELAAIKDNILHTKMHGHKLTETEDLASGNNEEETWRR